MNTKPSIVLLPTLIIALLISIQYTIADSPPADKTQTIKQLNKYWTTVSKAVRTGDFELYKSTCHPEGILVATAGSKKISQPLSQALARWKKEFTATKSGQIKANATFRFSQRVNDTTT